MGRIFRSLHSGAEASQPDRPLVSDSPLTPDAAARREILASLSQQLAAGQITDYWSKWGAAGDGARRVMTRRQKVALALVVLIPLILLVLWPRTTLVTAIATTTAVYMAMAVHKLWLLVRGERARADAALHPDTALGDQLPRYTILVPLHREGRILPELVARLARLDYPTELLQVLLLVEMDDDDTQRALDETTLPAHIRPMTMPPGQPRTKPRALNIGLREATGEFVVIYDAEDAPEPDQLRKAVAAFRRLPEEVVCVQARLNFYNAHDTPLTGIFAVDYAVWYEEMLPGLARAGSAASGAFVPLGGTSNHFRASTLRTLGGWDPFNVTEDCDLGARLGRRGWRVAMIDSVTWEEAVRAVRPWVRQRSRWVKGYIQTYLVHMRHPWRLWRELGTRSFIDFQMLVGANSLVLLLNPVMWLLTLVYIAAKGTAFGPFLDSLFPAPIYYPALLSLTAGNFVLFYVNAYVCVKREMLDLTRYALLTPLYWVLLSLGAWAGLISLIREPHYWAKTDHGAPGRPLGPAPIKEAPA